MLKLRKNKKGFTLVELIVVIAIMAVLAGTVAGVTVSQLNKRTDDANKTQAKKIADTIYDELLANVGGAEIEPNKPTTNATGASMQEIVEEAYGKIIKWNANAAEGKEFKVSYVAASGEGDAAVPAHYTVEYKGKQSGTKGDIKYFVTSKYGVQTKSVIGA